MTDLKVPVSAPGSQQAASDIDKATEAARRLILQKTALKKGSEDFKKAIEAEAKAFETKLSPALVKAREDARAYSEMMNKGMLSKGRSFLSSINFSNREGGESEALLGRGGALREFSHAASRVGGELGHVFHGLSNVAGGATGALAGVAAGALFLHTMFNMAAEAEHKRIEMITEEIKTRQELHKTLREAEYASQDAARGTFDKNDAAQRFIAGNINDPWATNELFNSIDKTGDENAYQSLAKFLSTKKGRHFGAGAAVDEANRLYDYGFTFSEALDAIQNQKGGYDLNRLVAEKYGYHAADASDELSDRIRDNIANFTNYTGATEAEERSRKAAQARMNRGRDYKAVVESNDRAYEQTTDPLGYATKEFKRGMEENIEVLKARAAAENKILRNMREWLEIDTERIKLRQAEARLGQLR